MPFPGLRRRADLSAALGLADGTINPADDSAEAAALLRAAARLRAECLGAKA